MSFEWPQFQYNFTCIMLTNDKKADQVKVIQDELDFHFILK